MTFSQLAIKVSPYFTTLITIQLVLTCIAILFGVFLILRRFLGHTDAPHSALESEQIAAEITEEMRRLADLRAKILPGAFGKSAHETTAHSEGAHHEPTPKAAGDHAADEKLVQSYEIRIKELESKLAAAASAAPAAPVVGGGDGKLELALATANKEKDDLSQKLAHVEKVLSEYKIFEEDFALVKKYKAENDRLKSQMAAGGAPSAAVSPDDINNLFDSLSGPKEQAKAPVEVVDPSKFLDNEFSVQSQPAPAPSPAPVQEVPAPAPQAAAPEPVVAQKSAPAPAPEVAAPAQTPATAPAPAPAETAAPTTPPAETAAPAPAEMTAPTPTPTPAPAAVSTEAAPTTEPAPANSKIVAEEKTQDLEALAESAVNDDQLIQEFEKILGDKK